MILFLDIQKQNKNIRKKYKMYAAEMKQNFIEIVNYLNYYKNDSFA